MGMAVTMLVMLGILTITLVGAAGVGGGRGYNGLLGLTDNALQSSAARTNSATAFNMAESGVQYTLAWLESLPQAPAGNAQAPTGWDFVTTGKRGVVTPDPSNPGNTFAVRIYPDAYNAVGTQKKYLIEVVGTSSGATSIVQAYVEEGSLSKYLVLLNQWNDPNNYWVSGLNEFDGPVHDNNANGIAESVAWKSAAGTSPMFTYNGPDAYTTSSPNGINWVKDFSSYAAPQIVTNANGTQTNQWLDVASGGAGSVHTGTPVVPFPTSSNIQKSAALGSVAVPSPVGVTLCPGGGVYVEGNVSEMALSASGTNNTAQVMTITQPNPLGGTTVQRVTIDPSLGTTTLETQQSNGSWLTTGILAGTGNGVVYVDGNIGATNSNPNPQTGTLTSPKTGGLHGVVADNAVSSSGIVTHNNGLNIVTPQNDSINLDGSVTYNTERQIAKDTNGNPEYTDVNGNPTSNPANGIPVYADEATDSNFTTKAGTIGIVTNNALVDQTGYTGAALNKFEMDGTVLASGIYDADNYTGRPAGLWENMGGYLSKTVGYFGTFNNNLTISNGFNIQFSYDARMQYAAPPYFPASPLSYSVISWHQVAAPLEP